MCGRFSISTPQEEIKKRFGIDRWEAAYRGRYNAAPGQPLPVVIQPADQRILAAYIWGLVPFWAKDKKIGNRLINARAETVASKPAFRSAFKRQRCLVPADGFFEWSKKSKPHVPFYITLKNRHPFAFAGIYDHWEHNQEVLHSFAIITTDANGLVARIHDRMPVILDKKEEALWLDQRTPLEQAVQLLTPYPAGRMQAYPISTLVNNPRHDQPEITTPQKGYSLG